MENKWKYVIELADVRVFDKLSDIYEISLPVDLRTFILEHNAGTPTNNRIIINNVQCIFASALSFNEDETEAVSVFDIVNGYVQKKLVPFGLDPFGNVFCYNLLDGCIWFHDHEENEMIQSRYTIDTFEENLSDV